MEICIAVADWARGLTAWVLDVPGGEGTGARLTKRPRHIRQGIFRGSPSGSAEGSTVWEQGAGMVVGWG
ncbi:hypothetical protein GCM10009564_07540 [Streptomyces thermogriseus]|uniref:Uncharacterized protein n=1 Tax=Streptomyces thermogriseus TaxID=75292 RepID=A0ABP4DC33_9ACTN